MSGDRSWVDPARFDVIVLDAVEVQPIETQRALRDALHAGAAEIWRAPGSEWCTIVLAGVAVAEVHVSRITRDAHPASHGRGRLGVDAEMIGGRSQPAPRPSHDEDTAGATAPNDDRNPPLAGGSAP